MTVTRIGWIDNARGIGIIFVVMAHTIPSIGQFPISDVIFTFHMPLFVFLTTMLMKDHPGRETGVDKGRKLLIPYAAYVVLLGVPYLVLVCATSITSGGMFALRLVLGGTLLFGPFGTFWYVPAIYIALVCYAYLIGTFDGPTSKSFILAICCLLILAYAISYFSPNFPVPYALHVVPALVVLIWVGRMIPWHACPTLLTTAAVLVMAVVVAFNLHGADPRFAFNLKNGVIGIPVIGILIAVAGSQLCFAAARRAEQSKLASAVLGYVGKITMPILFLHQAVHFSLVGIGVGDRRLSNEMFIFCISLAGPILLARVLQRVAPAACPYLGIPITPGKAAV